MPELLDEANFENQICNMTDRQLSEFNARQLFEICKTCKIHSKQIADLQAVNRRAYGASGGIGAILGTFFGAAVLYVYERLRG